MEVRRQIIVCFIVCCAKIIYTTDTEFPSEDSSSLTETVYLKGKITAYKNGVKVELGVNSKAFWKGHKSIDSETCTEVVKEKGDRGDKGADGKPGDKGESGRNGTAGQQGEKGKDEVYNDSDDRESYGEESNPAYSCNSFDDTGNHFLNPANGFEVLCDSYKSCIRNPNETKFTDVIKNERVWLSSYNLNLAEFYSLKISQLSYLMTTTESVDIKLRYNNEMKILKILGWNGIDIEISPNILSNRCKGSTSEEGTHTLLHLTCDPPDYLPMDFHIETKTEKVLIELQNLCFD